MSVAWGRFSFPAGRVPLTSASTQPGAAHEAAASPHRNVSFIDLPGYQNLTTSAPLGGASSILYPATASRMGDKTMAQSPKSGSKAIRCLHLRRRATTTNRRRSLEFTANLSGQVQFLAYGLGNLQSTIISVQSTTRLYC